MMATFQLRYLGGATIKSDSGDAIVEKIGIPVVTVYGHKLITLIEFQDEGYHERNMFFEEEDDLVGAHNNLWDFQRKSDRLDNLNDSFIYTEPVIKALDLNTSWDRSEIKLKERNESVLNQMNCALNIFIRKLGDIHRYSCQEKNCKWRDVGHRTKVQFNIFIYRDIFEIGLSFVREMARFADIPVDLQDPSRNGGVSQVVILVILETQKPHDVWSVSLLFVFIKIHNRHVVHVEAWQPFRDARGNRFCALDRIEKIFAQSLFYNFLRFAAEHVHAIFIGIKFLLHSLGSTAKTGFIHSR